MDRHSGFDIAGQIVDVVGGRIFPGTVTVQDGHIAAVKAQTSAAPQIILPGLVDAHVHIESSLLVPSEFARLAVLHGSVGAAADPHEIGNVLGMAGVEFMLQNAGQMPFAFCFGAPSCVPATPFETSGAHLGAAQVKELLDREDVYFLAEMMNFPGVLEGNAEVMAKIDAARKHGKPVDGHAPLLSGDALKRYIAAGISTDHECTSLTEAEEKAALGMHVLIREGSAARNFEALCGILEQFPQQAMFCSDDKHPDDLLEGHINVMVRMALQSGVDALKVLRAATLNPVRHYRMPLGLLQEGDRADFIVASNWDDFRIEQVYIGGAKVAEDGRCLMASRPVPVLNHFAANYLQQGDLQVKAGAGLLRVLEVEDHELLTREQLLGPLMRNGEVVADPQRDILKLVVLNRYQQAKPAVGFVRNMGFKRGAAAMSIAHDSHNIVACGVSDEEIIQAVNLVIKSRGGIAIVNEDGCFELALPVAGLMSQEDGFAVAGRYQELQRRAQALGSHLTAPLMTLSFLALLVIPELRLSDRGLFDSQNFKFVPLFAAGS